MSSSSTPYASSRSPYQARKAGGGTNTLRQDNQAVHPACTSGDCCSVSASTLNAFTSN